MIIVNRIVNILILLAAIAAVVFSYMLFSKRERLLNGWAQMAKAIQTTAKTLDDGGASGTTAARDLPEDQMLHTNYDRLEQVLPKLNKNAKDLITQRNDLARTMRDVAGVLRVKGVTDSGLKNIASYKDQERILLNNTRAFLKVSDGVSAGYCDTARIFGVNNVTANQLRAMATYSSAMQRINDAAREAVRRRNDYQRYLTQFSRAARVKAPSFAGSAYRSNLEAARRQIAGKLSELDRVSAALKREQNLTKSLNRQIAAHRSTIRVRDNSIKKHQEQIKFLQNVLSMDGTKVLPPKLLTNKDVECYNYVRGKIQYVDKEYGFVTVNIGKNFVFVQPYGIKKNYIHFPLKSGSVMTVVRSYGNETPVVIGKVKVTKVENDLSVCNLLDGKPALYQVGDDVIFSADDVALITGKKKK